MPLRNFDNAPSEDEYYMERRLSVKDNDMAFALVLCVIILGGICACIKINSWVTAAKMRERELNDARAEQVGGDDDEEETIPPSKPPKKKKKKSSEERDKNLSKNELLQESAKS